MYCMGALQGMPVSDSAVTVLRVQDIYAETIAEQLVAAVRSLKFKEPGRKNLLD